MRGKPVSYRARKACREEYKELRARLGRLKDTEWQQAGRIMGQIALMLGHRYGPMGGKIEPRACRFCHYYGHSKQYCAKRKAYEQQCMEAMLKEDEELRNRPPPPPKEPYDPLKSNLAKHLDEYGLPFVVDSAVGILHGARGEKHAGKWTYDENGVVVERIPDTGLKTVCTLSEDLHFKRLIDDSV